MLLIVQYILMVEVLGVVQSKLNYECTILLLFGINNCFRYLYNCTGCTIDDVVYPYGERFTADDGCNTWCVVVTFIVLDVISTLKEFSPRITTKMYYY